MTATPAATTMAEESFPGIRKLMGEQVFNEAGLGRLSEAQLKALNEWLVQYTGGEAKQLRLVNEEVREAEKAYQVIARLPSDFSGWDGGTVFRLDNGQVWRQRLSGRYIYRGDPAPEAAITKNWLGFHVLTIISTGKSVGVSRIQ